MKRTLLIALSAGAAIPSPAIADAQAHRPAKPVTATTDVPNPKALVALRTAMHRMVDVKKRAGITYGVVYRGKLVAIDSYGYRNVERKLPMTPDTIVRLFSMLRAITTVAFLTLVESGKVNLDDPVSRYLPAFADTRVFRTTVFDPKDTVAQDRPMTVRTLLNYHSSLGYPFDYPATMDIKQTDLMGPGVSTKDGIDGLARLPPFNHPGGRWRYGFHSDVLGRIAEVVTGKPLDQFSRENLLDRIGMTDTGFYAPPVTLDRLARADGPAGANPLGNVNAKWQPKYRTFDKPIAYLSAGGGVCSTLTDYLNFMRLLMGEGEIDGVRILTPETVRLMLTAQVPLAEGGGYHFHTGWGVGIGVRTTGTMRPGGLTRHEMFRGGLANTTFFADTDHDLAAVAKTQYFGPESDVFADGFRDAAYEALLP